jgi:hypothetical protein
LIVWAITEKGRRVPLDAKPQKVFVLDEHGTAKLVSGYTSHHATCPKADEFRTARKPAEKPAPVE